MAVWQQLGEYLRETRLLGSIQSTLYWDQNTAMPSGGVAWRGDQLSLIAREIHQRQTNTFYEDLLAKARAEFNQELLNGELDSSQQSVCSRNLDLLEEDLARQQKLDSALVVEIARAKSNGYCLWTQAKAIKNFSLFAPALKKLITLRQEQAKQLAEPRSCWETLAQPFEPDISLRRLRELFAPLRERLPVLMERVRSFDHCASNSSWDLEEASQQKLSDQLLSEWGRDKAITFVARSPHPFSITLGPRDFRLTTRVVSGQPFSSFLATAHEWGHSLYEQGLPSQTHQWFDWPLGQATSMAVHESQSLFWENRVARSKPFADRWWKRFALAGAPIRSGEELWRLMNPLMPGLNRVEADELSYGLHILIRTDLEIGLLEEGLEVDALPIEWNKRYKEMLGAVPEHDGEGCLQDVHWSEGLFGYFPSYLIGHLISAQFSEAMGNDLKNSGIQAEDPIDGLISQGAEATLLSWLRENVHTVGRQTNGEKLVEKVSGERLSSVPFLRYLEKKIGQLGCFA